MSSLEQIGRDFKIAREKLGLTQAQVAEKVGIDTNYYARIERGEVNAAVKTLKAIGKLLKLKSLNIL